VDLTADDFEDLVGAFALDACEPDETEAMERYLAAHPPARAEVEQLREVAAGIGAAGASQPPVSLRERLLHAAGERVAPVAPAAALQRETDRFDAFLQTLADADLGVTTENGLTVRELVQHLEAVDRAFLAAAGGPERAFIGPDDIAAITAADLPGRVDESFAESVDRFRQTRGLLGSLAERVPRGQPVAGYDRDSLLVIRAFETWTHHEDAEHALGRPATMPVPEVMRAMAELTVDTLPIALALRGTARPGVSARVVLVGPGGGEWNMPCAPGEPPSPSVEVVLRAPVGDWCRRFADRIQPSGLAISVDGDTALAADLVAAADAFAAL
jgi:uncharacterized protein (TIGR03083 family)